MFVNNPASCCNKDDDEPFNYVDPWDAYQEQSPEEVHSTGPAAVIEHNKATSIAKDMNQRGPSDSEHTLSGAEAAPPTPTSPQPQSPPPLATIPPAIVVVEHCPQDQQPYSTSDPSSKHNESPPVLDDTPTTETEEHSEPAEAAAEEVGSESNYFGRINHQKAMSKELN